METILKSSKDNKIVKQNIKLVDGLFTPSDASDIVNSVLDVKINHHKLKRLSITEGNSKDLCEYDNGRITELIDAKLDAKSFFSDAKLKGKKLKIEGTISISIQD
ncbi:hypothetical protein A8C32_18445 [Flavivirga aquatica]|uniref:Uncharacterized protein n=1 Tax=Flavivirga aquatica TaxID=1849968 RepID=A0A1E5T7Q9_9FLAO|nr:hypothetical protein [Flavivirga aquatica]OEK07413.1 hypothetical protein A8C32_18445 [Flavivirga aquatica]